MDQQNNQNNATQNPTMNEPEHMLPIKPLTLNEVRDGIMLDELENDVRLRTIAREFRDGFDFIKQHKMHIQSVTFFGSAEFKEDNPYYQSAYNLAQRLSKELGYAIVTGGGPGIMEAANRGAYEAGGKSFGICIELPFGEAKNPYITDAINLYYFFTRKVLLAFAASAYIYFPGGYGTLDELFEILTLVKTNKIEPVPIILFGDGYWHELNQFLVDIKEKYKTVYQDHLDVFTITNDPEEVIRILQQARPRQL